MLVLVTYDVNTETAAGRKRLRKVAKACVNHGQRVQNSVFECLLDAAQYAMFKAQLTALIDPAADSLRWATAKVHKNLVHLLRKGYNRFPAGRRNPPRSGKTAASTFNNLAAKC